MCASQLVAWYSAWALCTLLISYPSSAAAQSPGRVLYAFSECGDSIAPLIGDARGDLYGVTTGGGSGGAGCVFELSPAKNGWQETTLYSFSGPDGSGPIGALVFDKAGNLYGTTVGGGAYSSGTAFELSPSGNGSWTETVLHNFGEGTDGAGPKCDLIFDAEGNLYGTTLGGGTNTRPGGTVFKLSPGQNSWTEAILYSFPGFISGPDGSNPVGGIVRDSGGRLYGSTQTGGAYGNGAVYELVPSGNGYKEKVIYSFNGGDGSQPTSGLAIGPGRSLFGTTMFGGTSYLGVVFRLSQETDGTWSEEILHEMIESDGRNPVGPPVFDSRGNLYAAGQFGGINNGGSVFMLTPTQSAPWTETVLHLFDFIFPNGKGGQQPYAGVIYGAGRVFGTTSSGGVNDAGIVFEIKPPTGAFAADQSTPQQ